MRFNSGMTINVDNVVSISIIFVLISRYFPITLKKIQTFSNISKFTIKVYTDFSDIYTLSRKSDQPFFSLK